jgi:hypothetical protein
VSQSVWAQQHTDRHALGDALDPRPFGWIDGRRQLP